MDCELAELAADLTGDLPIGAKKVINKAVENGWQLNAPGMTVSLRLNHPTDELALPVYVTWIVKRTPSGKIGFTFFSAGTASMVPMRPADLLEYLEDPTVAYTLTEEAEEAAQAKMDFPEWDKRKEPEENLLRVLRADVIEIIDERPGKQKRKTFEQIMREQREKLGVDPSQAVESKEGTVANPSGYPKPAAAGLRVSL